MYFSNNDPSTILPSEAARPTMKVKVIQYSNAKSLLKAVVKKCPEMANESAFNCINILDIYLYLLYLEYLVLVHDAGIWSAYGHYKDIIAAEEEEDIEWEFHNNEPLLHILLVCSILFLILNIYTVLINLYCRALIIYLILPLFLMLGHLLVLALKVLVIQFLMLHSLRQKN